MPKKRLLASIIAALAILAGCSGETFNDQDVRFATDMIAHHQQAIEMSALAPERGASPEVAKLAKAIEAAQQPEIDTMKGWLEDWGKPVPQQGAMDHGAGGMHELSSASGPAFDKLFLEQMIEHHEGAVTMAKAEQSSGKNEEAKALAERVIADQTAEIATMRELLR